MPFGRTFAGMAGSLKDALQKSGLAPKEPAAPASQKASKTWLNELPDSPEGGASAHVPFEAPALTKAKPSSPRVQAPKPREPASDE